MSVGQNPNLIKMSIADADRNMLTVKQAVNNKVNNQQFDYSFTYDSKNGEHVAWFMINTENYKSIEDDFQKLLEKIKKEGE